MICSINGMIIPVVSPRYSGKQILIAIDSSKTNSAIAVGDLAGNLLDYIELNGSADGTSCEDTLRLCKSERKVISELFRGAVIAYAGIENIITKRADDERYSGGITHHLSRFKITAVFMSFISCFQDRFNVELELINNQEWKAGVLPAEFRTRAHKKGSLDYLRSIQSKYGHCSDDVTDAICILEYLYKIHNVEKAERVEEPEPDSNRHTFSLVGEGTVEQGRCKRFVVNRDMSLEQNAVVISNRLKEGEIGIASVNVQELKLKSIYLYCKGSFRKQERNLFLKVERAR